MSTTDREENRARIEASEARVTSALDAIRVEAAEARADMRTEMASLRVDMEKLRTELHTLLANHTKWIALMFFSSLAAAASLWTFLKPVTQPTQTPAPAPAPYVIYVQPSPPHPPSKVAHGELP